MKAICENCPEAKNCEKMCKKLLKQLEVPGFMADGEISKLDQKKFDSLDTKGDIDNNPKASPFKIDVGSKYAADTDFGPDWVQTTVQPESADLDEDVRKILTEAVWWAIPRDNPKLRRRFNAFLKCSKIVDIAKAANTTKQNIQKQFQSVIRRVHKILKRDGIKTDDNPKPLQLKKKVT
jgi:hypothetical protein